MRFAIFILLLASVCSADSWDHSEEDFDPCDHSGTGDITFDPCAPFHAVMPGDAVPHVFEISFPNPSGGQFDYQINLVPAVGSPLDTLRVGGRLFCCLMLGVVFVNRIWRAIRQW